MAGWLAHLYLVLMWRRLQASTPLGDPQSYSNLQATTIATLQSIHTLSSGAQASLLLALLALLSIDPLLSIDRSMHARRINRLASGTATRGKVQVDGGWGSGSSVAYYYNFHPPEATGWSYARFVRVTPRNPHERRTQ